MLRNFENDLTYISTTKDLWNVKANGQQITFYNCTFFGSDGVVLKYVAKNALFKNNLFKYNDWSAADNDFTNLGGYGDVYSIRSYNDTFIRNTL